MREDVILARWVELERGDGIQRARRTARMLSVGAFLLMLTTCVGGGLLLHDFRSLVLVVPSAAVGWMLAERNALESRVACWPIFRQYIDWSRVQPVPPAER